MHDASLLTFVLNWGYNRQDSCSASRRLF